MSGRQSSSSPPADLLDPPAASLFREPFLTGELMRTTIVRIVLCLMLLSAVACPEKKAKPPDMDKFSKEEKMKDAKTPPLPDPKKASE